MKIMTDSPIRFPGLFGDWTITLSSKAINIGNGIYWYGPGSTNENFAIDADSRMNLEMSDWYVENGSYLRFQNITLGYNVHTEFLSFTKYVSGLRVYASLQNFFTITSYSGDNPEVSKYGQDNLGAGYDAFSYPFAKSVLFGLNVKF